MKYLGNIVTDRKFENNVLYNVVKDKKDIIEDIPTLIIGYEKTKTIYSSFSVLDWRIEKNIYWCYGRRERGDRYFDSIEKFKQLCMKILLNSIKYNLFNVITETTEKKKSFFKFLKDNTTKTFFIYEDMVYVYYDNKHVTGFSLRDIDYIGGNKKRVLSIILSSENKVLNTKEVFKDEISYKLKDKPYIIPYLYS